MILGIRKDIIILVAALLIITAIALLYVLTLPEAAEDEPGGQIFPPTRAENRTCYFGAAVKAFGYTGLGEKIFLRCKCNGTNVHKSSPGLLDADWMECDGEIEYTCYRLNGTLDGFPLSGELFDELLLTMVENFTEIPCPPNHWMGDAPEVGSSQADATILELTYLDDFSPTSYGPPFQTADEAVSYFLDLPEVKEELEQEGRWWVEASYTDSANFDDVWLIALGNGDGECGSPYQCYTRIHEDGMLLIPLNCSDGWNCK